MSDVAVLPKFPIPGYEGMSIEEASRALHDEMNTPFNEFKRLKFPKYVFRPFPVALYRHWNEAHKRREVIKMAGLAGVPLSDDRQMLALEDTVPEFETLLLGKHDYGEDGTVNEALRAKNDADLAIALGQGWATTPGGVKDAEARVNRRIADAAAERTHADRHLTGPAKAELDAIENASDLHVVEIPEARKGELRPKAR